MPLHKPELPSGPADGICQPSGGWASAYPTVWEFLSLPCWADGSPRLPGTITLFTDSGAWKVTVKDKDGGLVAFLTAASPEGLLERLEAGLVNGTLDWRREKPFGKGKAPRTS
jgi:hypothetical protein